MMSRRGCINAGVKTARVVTNLGTRLTYLNLSGTSLDLEMLERITLACTHLEVLKIADCRRMSGNAQKPLWEKWAASVDVLSRDS